MQDSTKNYIKETLMDNHFGILKIKNGTQEFAEKLARDLDCAVGVTQFLDKNGNFSYGVLIDKRMIR